MSDISIPNFRFKKYTSNLVKTRLSKIATFNPKSSLPENFKYIDLESVLGTELVSYREETRESAPSRAQRVAQKGDVFYQMVRPYQKNNYLFDLNENNYVFSTGYAQLRPKVDSAFLLARLQEEGFVNKVIERCTGTSYPAINSKDLSRISITIPEDLDEQSAIGSFFRTLDDLMASYTDNLANYQSLKATMLSKMFPKAGQTVPEIRLDGFEGEWEKLKLRDVVHTNPKSELPENFKYIDLESVVGTRINKIREERKESAPSRAQRLAKKGDVFYQTVRPYQKNNYLFKLDEIDYVFSTGYAQLRPIFKRCDSDFLLILLQNNRFLSKVLDRCTGTSYPAINVNDLIEILIALPSYEEQQAIGVYFSNLDNLINSHQEKISQLETLKKKLLQDMFI